MSAVDDYRAALQRLIAGKPTNISKGYAINNDTVALEAGRKRGTIKKSRPEHAQLIEEIQAAATSNEIIKPTHQQIAFKQRAQKQAIKDKLEVLKNDYELALTKIVSLEHENHTLKTQIKELTEGISNKIIGIGKKHFSDG
ncbi:hypothetical protein D3C71_284550 [compost metagenome]